MRIILVVAILAIPLLLPSVAVADEALLAGPAERELHDLVVHRGLLGVDGAGVDLRLASATARACPPRPGEGGSQGDRAARPRAGRGLPAAG